MEHRSHEADFDVSGYGRCERDQRIGEFASDVAHAELREAEYVEPVNCTAQELSIFLQALAEGYSPTYCLDTSQSAPLRSITIASKFWQRGKKTGCFPGFQSLQMSSNLTDDRGEELLTWYREVSHARTSRAPGQKPVLAECDQGFGQRWQGSFARLSRDGFSWKTAQTSLLEDSETFSQIWPRWGSMRSGHVFQRATLVRHKPATGSGLLPTLVAGDARGGRNGTSKNRAPSDGMTMTDWVWANIGRGRLHPESAEWMMLWPEGWTDLKPLETARFRQWLREHSPSYRHDSDKAAA